MLRCLPNSFGGPRRAPSLIKLQVLGSTPPHLKDATSDPEVAFWSMLFERRSVRRFKPDPVPRDVLDALVHAGTWAPSSCNYQMWDLVVVDDPEINRQLGELSTQMANAPVNVVVSYGRDFGEEGFANIQSASAMIQNMSLAAHALGLGSFWITAMGGAERVREVVGLPRDRFVVAVLAVGYPDWPAGRTPRAPKRRPLADIRHFNHYGGRPIPGSADPNVWEPDLLATYQRARVLNGLRHNKPRPWEVRALETALDALVPEGRDKPAEGVERVRALDVLSCTGIVLEKMSKLRPGLAFDVVERSRGVAEFAGNRPRPKAAQLAWPSDGPSLDADHPLPAPEAGGYDLITCLFRLEGLPASEREAALAALASWLKPGGALVVGVVSKRSFHDWTERLRARRGGPRGVEYVLSPDPNIGPFEAVDVAAIERAATGAGLVGAGKLGLQAVPQPEEIAFRTRNFGSRARGLAGFVGKLLAALEKLPGVEGRYGRFQFRRFEKRA